MSRLMLEVTGVEKMYKLASHSGGKHQTAVGNRQGNRIGPLRYHGFSHRHRAIVGFGQTRYYPARADGHGAGDNPNSRPPLQRGPSPSKAPSRLRPHSQRPQAWRLRRLATWLPR